MDLLQETSSIWNEFLTKPCPWVDLLSFWPRHPWHLLNPGTLENFCLLAHFVPWHPWYLLSPDTFVTVHYSMVKYSDMKIEIRVKLGLLNVHIDQRQYSKVQYSRELYCTVQYHIMEYCATCYFYIWYTPLVEVNQAIYARSFRQKV